MKGIIGKISVIFFGIFLFWICTIPAKAGEISAPESKAVSSWGIESLSDENVYFYENKESQAISCEIEVLPLVTVMDEQCVEKKMDMQYQSPDMKKYMTSIVNTAKKAFASVKSRLLIWGDKIVDVFGTTWEKERIYIKLQIERTYVFIQNVSHLENIDTKNSDLEIEYVFCMEAIVHDKENEKKQNKRIKRRRNQKIKSGIKAKPMWAKKTEGVCFEAAYFAVRKQGRWLLFKQTIY